MQVNMSPVAQPAHPRMFEAAQKVEAQFLAMMLETAGLNKTPQLLGGGQGESQFASLMNEQQAQAMVRAGGIGLAQSIYDAMVARHAG